MGRIKGTLVKRTTKTLLTRYRDQFTADFGANKKAIDSISPGIQKKIKNSIAGFISRKVKRELETEKKK